MWYLCNCYLQPSVGGFFWTDSFDRIFLSDQHITATVRAVMLFLGGERLGCTWASVGVLLTYCPSTDNT